MTSHPIEGALLVVFALLAMLPPAILVVRLRNVEIDGREPWSEVGRAALWGATGAAILSIIIELAVDDRVRGTMLVLPPPALASLFQGWQGLPLLLPVTTVVVAPVVEELAKAGGLVFVRDADPEPEDGFIYGGAAGLGFAATENLFYVLGALLLGGVEAAATTALYRGIVTVPLHAAASAIAGYGIWQARYRRRRLAAVGALGIAIGLHVAYNGISSTGNTLAVVGAGVLAVIVFLAMVARVRALDDRTLPRRQA